MKANCDCGKYHPSKTEYAVGDNVRIRVHWRCRHMTGTVLAKREGFNEGVVYDVKLDEPCTTGLHVLTAMQASELWVR